MVMQEHGTNHVSASLVEGKRLLKSCHFVLLGRLQINVSDSSQFLSTEHRDHMRFIYWHNYAL